MLDISLVVPLRTFEAPRRWPVFTVRRAISDGTLSLLLNLAVVGPVVFFAPPVEIRPSDPPAITVDLVNEPPGTASPSGATQGSPGTRAAAPQAKPSDAADEPKPEIAAPSVEPSRAAKPPDPLAQAIPLPEASLNPPADREPARAGSDERRVAASRPASATPATEPVLSAPPPALPAPSAAAVPPPLGHGDEVSQPRLIEAPAAPHPADHQAEEPAAANTAAASAQEKPDPAPAPAPVPPVLSSPTGQDEVAAVPASQSVAPAVQPTPEEKRQAENTAKLAAAMPLTQAFAPASFQAARSVGGSPTQQAYRGAVYAAFHRADDIAESARVRHLRGQAVIAFTVDDTGALVSAEVAITSGVPAVDEAALDIIKRSAPFPPPPPGAQRSFAPAIALGLEGQ